MTEFENELRYPETTSLIYRECANRLKKRKLSLNLTDAELAGDYDRKVINRILNGRRTRNNPYLIPRAYVKPLMDKLGFSEYEIFWGDKNDEKFFEIVFCNLITDILYESSWNEEFWDEEFWEKKDSFISKIEAVLIDDVAYAKIRPSVMQSFERETPEGGLIPISPISYVNGTADPTYEERNQARQNAIVRLFKNTRPIKMLSDFFTETNDRGENKGFSKLDKRLDAFVQKSISPFIEENELGGSSLGRRVYSIIAADMRNYAELELMDCVFEYFGEDPYITPEYDKLLKALVYAGRDYINQIEDLQVQFDALHRKEKFRR